MYDVLKLENQLCFPVYALSRKFTTMYQPFLAELAITYPQYLVMLVLWEHKTLSVKKIGEFLFLDSGTLTPLLKRLEKNNLVTRKRSEQDERVVLISLTKNGNEMKIKAQHIPLDLNKQIQINEMKINSIQKLIKELTSALYSKELKNRSL
jgi:DNA-binding MarR family transcriptional regulator